VNRLTTPIVGAVRRLYRWDHKMDPRVAWLSPMPPARSGIATYSQAVLEGLERIGYTPTQHKIQPYWPIKHQHWATVPWHTMGVYHLGNNLEFHGDIYDLAIRTPGLLVIHDLALDDFVMGMVATAQPFGHQALREGLLLAPRLHGFEEAERNEPLRVPYVAHAARNARGIVVHSPFVERYLRAFGCKTPIYVAPHPVVESEPHVRKAESAARVIRGSLESMGMGTLIGVSTSSSRRWCACRRTCISRWSADGSPGTTSSRWCGGADSAPACRCTPTCRTRTSSRGCAPRTSRSISATRTGARSPVRSRGRCRSAARRS
jgi:hypothetical protein